jgi:hypothetical protein
MRDADTYRAKRRNEWRRATEGGRMGWREFNIRAFGGVGYSIPEKYKPARTTMRSWVARSKYMPHIGAKQRAKGVAV